MSKKESKIKAKLKAIWKKYKWIFLILFALIIFISYFVVFIIGVKF